MAYAQRLRSKQRVSYEEFYGEVFDEGKTRRKVSKKKAVGVGKQFFPIEVMN